MEKDEHWMKVAIEEAKKAIDENEVPVGAVIVQGGKLIARAHNCPISKNDPTAHAEIEAIRKAAKELKNYRISNSTLYVTLEPCIMCFGAMIHARIDKIVFGASDPKGGLFQTPINLNSKAFLNHRIKVRGGVLDQECRNILQSFFRLRRK